MSWVKFWNHRNGELGKQRDENVSCFPFPFHPPILILALKSHRPHFFLPTPNKKR